MNFSGLFEKLKALLVPLALGVIALSQNPATAVFLPAWAVPVATALAALAHVGDTASNPEPWRGE